MVGFWEMATGKERLRIDQRPLSSKPIAFSPDGKKLLVASEDGRLQLWDTASGKELHPFPVQETDVSHAAYAPNGKYVVSASADTTLLVWNVAGVRTQRGIKSLTPHELSEKWDDLASADGCKAYQAIVRLVHSPEDAIPFLSKQLRPIPQSDPVKIKRWLTDLDSDTFTIRAEAAKQLENLQEGALPALRQALESPLSAEAHRQIERLLSKCDAERFAPSLERVRLLRAVEVLELLGTLESRSLLRSLSEGAPDAWLTQEGKQALRRLTIQSPAP
jgi:hypothetical protein